MFRMFTITLFFIITGLAFADCPDGTDVCLSLDGSNLDYVSSEDIYGFQISHDGCITNAAGGDAAIAGFMISTSGSVVLGFSLTGSFIPDGSGTLIELSGDVTEDCIGELVFSGAGGEPITAFLAQDR